jgi:transcriptional regulator with GAF, ATPase, and Fis domain
MPLRDSSSKSFMFHPGPYQDTEKMLDGYYDLLWHCIPLDLMVLYTIDLSVSTMFLYALITDQGTLLRHERRKVSAPAIGEYKKIFPIGVYLFPNLTTSPAAQDFFTDFPIPQPFTAVNVHTTVKPDTYACLGLCANGTSRYSKHHLDLLNQHYHQIIVGLRYVISELDVSSLKTRIACTRQEVLDRLGYLGDTSIVGAHGGLEDTLDLVKKVASLNSTVLITGETGVGKEVIANAIHRNSGRTDQPFVSVNCGAIPETLLDSELFGHEKGAFTDAHSLKEGFFEQADGGSIFLDEIGELSCSAQVKLLRLLQTMQFHRVGGRRLQTVDVRVIAATNRDISAMVRSGIFRKDLWFRINVFPINVPPLRKRKQDISPLALHFARFKSKEMALPWRPGFADEAMSQLEAYDWPGNVRELQNVIERSLIIAQGKPMSFPNLNLTAENIDRKSAPDDQVAPCAFLTLESVTKRHIKQAISISGGKIEGKGGAADLLGMTPSTLRARIKKLGIRRNAATS